MEWRAAAEANRVIRDRNITKLPVDPMALARDIGIEVQAKPASARGVSGMLMRVGNEFGIVYATHIDNPGFQNFSVAHELGHYYMPGHDAAVFRNGEHPPVARRPVVGRSVSSSRPTTSLRHSSCPTRSSAKHSAPRASDSPPSRPCRTRCVTSLTATAIRYAQRTDDAVAVVVSSGQARELLLHVADAARGRG